jgi:glycerol-3-phosphate dehydrogenase
MMHSYRTQVAIIGGGISGLWLLNSLRAAGLSAILLEKKELGVMQTLASQGMIHGGIKYALGGFTTPSSETIAAMPDRWRECLAGTGSLDLRGVNLLSEDYYLFSDNSISSRVTAFFGSKSVRGRVEPVDKSDYPAFFADNRFKGILYRLQDIVIDANSLVSTLAEPMHERIFHADPVVEADGNMITGLRVNDSSRVVADRYIFAAGAGNENLLKQAGIPLAMQRRPLHQVMVKGESLPCVYAHAVSLSAGAKPRVTISTHPTSDGQRVWYLGGNLAETGVSRDDAEQCAFAQRELRELFPWFDWDAMAWRSYRIDRAEPRQADHSRPDAPFAQAIGNTIVCWPTKLTLVPLLAAEVERMLDMSESGADELPIIEHASVGSPPWEQFF